MILREGDSGPEVEKVQLAVGAVPDGIFGPKTKAAVIAFQTSHGLVPDGIVGPKTIAAFQGEEIPPVIDAPNGMWVPTGKPRVKVIDIYHGNDISDLNTVKNHAACVIHKCTLVSKSGGTLGHDSAFLNRWWALKAHEIRRGAYHWYEQGPSGKEQADFFIDYLGDLDPRDRILALDYEPLGSSVGPHHNDDIEAFGERIMEKTGRIPFFYSSKSAIKELGHPSYLKRWYNWLAAPSDETPPVIAPFIFVALHQFAESSFPGMSGGGIDLNWFPGSAEELDLL